MTATKVRPYYQLVVHDPNDSSVRPRRWTETVKAVAEAKAARARRAGFAADVRQVHPISRRP